MAFPFKRQDLINLILKMWIVYMFFKNSELHKKYKKHIFLRKKKATEVINFGFSKPDKETLIS